MLESHQEYQPPSCLTQLWIASCLSFLNIWEVRILSWGLTVLLTVSFEIPIFQVAPRLLERFGSGTLLLVASLCYIFRAVGYSCIPVGHIWYVLGLEPLHGVTYACSQVSSVCRPQKKRVQVCLG